ncbi:hypothetical protein C5167_024905 [Papaver somniferum]|uniref:Uncharacterized protein n=1 Tax=Papaver somniferum TaxID=3469 RepID=A0A4Y7JRJ3_PAPSO|nr:protein LURP-one-related 10-like [Papaver somniferum]RZC63156.1 hypothetical protein C5167_024905 [Papaver somniferum]
MASNRAIPNDSVIVISPQYCAPRQVDLYIAKKVKKVTEGRHLGAFDINDNCIFIVKTGGFFGSRLILVDAAGVPVVSLKPVTLSPNYRWKIYRGDSTDSKDLLFSVKKSQHPIKFKTELDVFLSSNTTEDLCDFKISQTYSENSCVIYRGDSDNIIAEMNKKKTVVRDKTRGKDRYSATVHPNVDYAFVIAMYVVLNEINTSRSNGEYGYGGGDGTGCGGAGCGGGCGG